MKKLIFLLVLIVIGIANAKAQSTPSSMPVQKNTEVKVAKTVVQIPVTTAGNNLSSDQPSPTLAQKMVKKDAATIKMPVINKEQSINATPLLINDKKKEAKTKTPPLQNLDSGKQ